MTESSKERCPTCGEPVKVVTSDEGTSHYESVAAAEIERLRRDGDGMRLLLYGGEGADEWDDVVGHLYAAEARVKELEAEVRMLRRQAYEGEGY